MESYYEKLNEYYREKNKGIKCKGCKELKVFKEDKGILSFSCGGKDKCSRSFKIKLSEYINYNDILHEYTNFINKNNVKQKDKDSITKNLEDVKIDECFQITDQEALPIIYNLLQDEGLCMGGSTGINIAGAIKMAQKLGPGHTIVTILCDWGHRYQSKIFNPSFLREKGLPIPHWLG